VKPQAVELKPLEKELSRAKSSAQWRLPYAARPRYIQLETVTKCNARCPFCPQNEIVRDPSRMPDEVWKKIIDDTRGWGMTYRPFLTNEPFVDNRQVEIVRYIKNNDPTAQVEFNTNGELMTDQLAAELLDAGVDIMRFSIDGFSAETYEPARVGIAYEKGAYSITSDGTVDFYFVVEYDWSEEPVTVSWRWHDSNGQEHWLESGEWSLNPGILTPDGSGAFSGHWSEAAVATGRKIEWPNGDFAPYIANFFEGRISPCRF